MAEVRDVAIIVLAAIFIIVGLGGAVLMFMLIGLVRTARKKVGPLLDSVLSTINTIEGTSSFVSDTMVRPIIRVASFGAGVKATMTAMARLRKRKGGR